MLPRWQAVLSCFAAAALVWKASMPPPAMGRMQLLWPAPPSSSNGCPNGCPARRPGQLARRATGGAAPHPPRRTAPWANLFTNIDAGAGTRVFKSGGHSTKGAYSGGQGRDSCCTRAGPPPQWQVEMLTGTSGAPLGRTLPHTRCPRQPNLAPPCLTPPPPRPGQPVLECVPQRRQGGGPAQVRLWPPAQLLWKLQRQQGERSAVAPLAWPPRLAACTPGRSRPGAAGSLFSSGQ